MPDVAGQIDGLLKKRGSPMAGLGSVFVGAAKKYGVDPRLVVSISGIESGFGKHILGGYNAWGWGPGIPFGSWEEGISTVTRGIKDGYYARGLRTPDQIVTRYAPGSDGNDEGNWARTVSEFMQQICGMAPIKTVKVGGSTGLSTTPSLSALAVPSSSGLESALISNLGSIAQHGGKADPFSMLSSLLGGASQDRETDAIRRAAQAAQKVPSATSATVPSSVPKSFKATGKPVPANYLTRVGEAHETAGLSGYPAFDYFGDAGAPVIAPVSGKIVRFSGHDPAGGPTSGVHGPFGWSIYLQGDDGHSYYMTHLGSRDVQVGQQVKAGAELGTIGDYARWGGANHVHMGVH